LDPETPAQANSDVSVAMGKPRGRIEGRVITYLVVTAIVVAVILLFPGLGDIRARLEHADPVWLVVACLFKLCSGAGYVILFRLVFCARMNWRITYQIGLAELGANALLSTAGTSGLALGAWALRRSGMPAPLIAARTVAFFLLTSIVNVAGVIFIGILLALGLIASPVSVALSLACVAVAGLAVAFTLTVPYVTPHVIHRLASHEHTRRVRNALAWVAEGVNEAVHLLRSKDPRLLGSVAYLGFDIAVLWACFYAFHSAPQVAVIAIAYLLGMLGGLLPIPGGIGGIEGGLVGALVVFGVSADAAIVSVIAYRAVALSVPTVLGVFGFLGMRRTLSNWPTEQARTQAGQIAEHHTYDGHS
jgi:uncharacterized protein (TIRG00374 family)